jgi:hypothetical protein
VAALRARAEAVTSQPGIGEDVASRLEGRLDRWADEAARPDRRLGYRARRGQGDVYGLLREPDAGPWGEWTCLTSMRDVEVEVRLILRDADLGEAQQPQFHLPAPRQEDGTP